MHDSNQQFPSAFTAHKTVSGDPIQVQIYTLSNGLQLFLSVNRLEPRVYTEIAVRAGSKHDPADTTGLAHYFEHMMFKGTDRLGTRNWVKEKNLLDQIEQKFEAHRKEQVPEKKKELYAEIDKLSFEAAGFAAANEYDKLVSAIGAQSTNAYTWVEQTVYVNDIPSNEIERWFELESERFRRPILRLFHTELETVFEEYNINQDKDFRKTIKVMQENLTPSHPYGTQTTLGRGEDLKNPSQTNIYRFFDTYYVPNNMGIMMSGDFDPKVVVALAERHFGQFKAKAIPAFKYKPQPPLEQRIKTDVMGNESAWIELGWRFEGAKSKEAMMLPLIAGLLHNYQAGLFDLNIIQPQRLLEASAYPRAYEDYSSLLMQAKPREGQTLETVEEIIMAEIEHLRKGEFENWLIEAVLKDLKLSEIKAFEKNQGRTGTLTNAFVTGVSWADFTKRWKILKQVTKADVMAFAQKHLRTDNYSVVYKHCGEDNAVMKVEKPSITPIEVNRDESSEYAKAFLAKDTPDIAPEFVDFKKMLKTASLSTQIKLRSVQQKQSQIFKLHYCFDMGRTADRRLSLLAGYLPYLGTSKYSAVEMQQEFYKLGVHFSATCQDDNFFLTLSGLEESFEAGVALMEHLLTDARPNAEAFENLINDILQRRENDKKDKRFILTKAMSNYAKYGALSVFSDKFTVAQLRAIKPQELLDLLGSLQGYQHEVFYFGKKTGASVSKFLKKARSMTDTKLAPALKGKVYPEIGTKKDKVFFVHFPTVQVELLLLSKGTPKFTVNEFVFSEWYNQYFGYGLSSIVFQEIRESKALAYSAYTYAGNPTQAKKAHWLQAYVGTQPDKLREAVEAFETILEDMPVSAPQIENARISVLKQIAASRVDPNDLYWNWRTARDRKLPNRDLRQDVYERLSKASMEDLVEFQKTHVKGRHYTWMILGDRAQVDFKYLKKIGKVQELSLEEVFGY